MAQDPWAKFRVGAPTAPSAPAADPIIRAADPYKPAAEARANRDQQLQEMTTATSVADTAHDNVTTDKKLRIGNPQDLRKEFYALPEVKTYTVAMQQLAQALQTGEGPQADLALTYAFAKAMDPDSVVREGEAASVSNSQAWLQATAENIKKQFGMDGAGNYTPEARSALRQQIIRATASRNGLYQAKRAQFEDLARRNGIDPYEVVGAPVGDAYRGQFRAYDDQRRQQGANVAPVSGSPEAAQNVQPPQIGGGPTPFAPGDPKMEAATGDERRTLNPEISAQIDKMIRKGAPLGAINSLLSGKGLSLVTEGDYAKVRDFLKQHPDYQGSVARAWKLEPISGYEKVVTQLGDNPVGAYFAGAGQFLTGNTMDSLAADPERARASLGVLANNNPNATAIGEISGGIMGSSGGEAALGRMGMAPGFLRGLAADTAMGAANGAGAADGPNQSRGLNALAGGAAAAAGNLAGNALIRGGARIVAPSGGDMAALYSSGVRSITPGQRFANAGPIGRMVNTMEQKLQSVAGTGDMISGARQAGRDEFQVGAFNEALREVGEQLPRGMKPGTAPHAYAQQTFNRIYAEARKGMRMTTDAELDTDIGALATDLSSLGPSAMAKFKSVVANHVNKRFVNGELAGDAYKSTISDLGKWATRFRRGQTAEDQALADAVESLSTSIENAARRHSDPEAVALLDAADAGYAKLVRIEDAARRAGGNAGTFSPNQFDRAVQNTAGGTRSKAYLRGDALMQDYAEAGKGLSDTVPNSGTADRLSIARLGLSMLTAPIGAAYAPGARKVMGAAMAPAGAKRSAIAAQLRKRAALAAKAGAASGVAALPGTSPGQ